MITVSSCAYIHTDDVKPDERIDARPIDAAMNLCVARATAALEQPCPAFPDILHRANMSALLADARNVLLLTSTPARFGHRRGNLQEHTRAQVNCAGTPPPAPPSVQEGRRVQPTADITARES